MLVYWGQIDNILGFKVKIVQNFSILMLNFI